MSATSLRTIKQVAAQAGVERFEIVRQSKHMIIDWYFPGTAKPFRTTMPTTLSDNARGLKNKVAELRRYARTH